MGVDTAMNRTSFHGHASVVVETGGLRIAIDPHDGGDCFESSWRFLPAPVPVTGHLDAILISHHHADHADPRVWARYPDVPVFVPAERPQLLDLARASGCRVRVLEHDTWWHFEADARVRCVPSDYNEIDASWIVEGPDGWRCLQGNDNFLSRETLQRIRRDVGRIHHVYAPFSYVWFYPWAVETLDAETKAREAQRVVEEKLQTFRDHVEILEPDVTIPCGGNLGYLGASDEMARAVLTPYEAFPEECAKAAPIVGGAAFLGPEARGEIKRARAAHKGAEHTRTGPWTEAQRRALQEKSYAARVKLEAIWCNDPKDERFYAPAVVITDLAMPPTSIRDRLEFRVEEPVLDAWARGRISFDDVLGTGRFKLWRWPEHFNRDLFQRLRRWL